MPASVRPRGSLPQRVYWVRRLVVLGVPLVLVVTLTRLLGGSSDGADEPRASQVAAGQEAQSGEQSQGPTAAAVEPADGANPKGKKQREPEEPAEPEEPVLPAPTGPCLDSDVVATPAITQVPGGSDVPITLNLRTRESIACTWQASADTMTVTITSGKDSIWSSRECPSAITPQDVVVYQATETPVVVTWNARRSDEDCSKLTEWAMPGFYHVQAAALAGEPSDVQFELVPPSAPVVTKTVKPKNKSKNKLKNKSKNKQSKNKPNRHESGDSGGGTSEPNG